MKVIMLLGIGGLAIVSTGCATLAEITIVGKPIDGKSMPHKDENYTVVNENGSTIFKLSAKGKSALSAHEISIEQMKARRKARAGLVRPLAGAGDWALSWPFVPLYMYGKAFEGGGGSMGPSFGNLNVPNLSGITLGGMGAGP